MTILCAVYMYTYRVLSLIFPELVLLDVAKILYMMGLSILVYFDWVLKLIPWGRVYMSVLNRVTVVSKVNYWLQPFLSANIFFVVRLWAWTYYPPGYASKWWGCICLLCHVLVVIFLFSMVCCVILSPNSANYNFTSPNAHICQCCMLHCPPQPLLL